MGFFAFDGFSICLITEKRAEWHSGGTSEGSGDDDFKSHGTSSSSSGRQSTARPFDRSRSHLSSNGRNTKGSVSLASQATSQMGAFLFGSVTRIQYSIPLYGKMRVPKGTFTSDSVTGKRFFALLR